MTTTDFESALIGSSLSAIDRPIDNTALAMYLTCRREFFYAMVLHRRGEGESAALVFGSWWHTALEHHYRGKTREEVQAAVLGSDREHGFPDEHRTKMRVLLDYDKYCKELADDRRYTIGWPDMPVVEMATNAVGGGLLHPWAGKLDRFYKKDGLVWVEDHKTTSRFDKNYFRQYGLSNQLKGYTYLARFLFPSEKIAGVRVNVSHVLKGKTEFYRQTFGFDKEEIAEWVRVTNYWLRQLNHDYEILNELAAKHGGREAIPTEALDEAFPPHYGENGCSRKYGMCQFHEVCSVPTKLRSRVLATVPVNPWNPLEADED